MDRNAAATNKSRESRVTYISDEAANLLKELVKGKSPDEYVFGNNGPLTTDSITSATTRILTRAKIRNVSEKISLHSCRKWFTTHMVEKGVPLPVVELMCGRTIGVTQSYLKPEESHEKLPLDMHYALQRIINQPDSRPAAIFTEEEQVPLNSLRKC